MSEPTAPHQAASQPIGFRLLRYFLAMAVVGAVSALIAHSALQRENVGVTTSLLRSMINPIISYANTGALQEHADQPGWYVFADPDHESLMQSSPWRSTSLDSPDYDEEGRVIDEWGGRIQIALRSDGQRFVALRVWSYGPDGQDGTNDEQVWTWMIPAQGIRGF